MQLGTWASSTARRSSCANAVSRSSYTSFFPDRKMYTYTGVITGREIVGGLTLLKMMYAVIKP